MNISSRINMTSPVFYKYRSVIVLINHSLVSDNPRISGWINGPHYSSTTLVNIYKYRYHI